MNLVGDRDEIAILKEAFEELDVNNDGKIDGEEIKKLNVDSKWKDVIKGIDLDGDGEINY